MKLKKKILISKISQFGYHNAVTKYCKYLDKSKYEIHYAGFDLGWPKSEIEQVHVHYVPLFSNKIKRYWVYLKQVNRIIRKENFDLLIIVDCQASLLIRLCNLFRKAVLDIRTGDVFLGEKYISTYNLMILFSSLFYKHIIILSENLRQLLRLPTKKCSIVPLGAELLMLPDKTFEKLYLLYIGILDARNIYQTIEGLAVFLERNKHSNVEYNIVGYGQKSTETKLRECIHHHGLDNIVIFHGRKNHNEISGILEKSNVGVAYVPITKGYTCQPTTKIYEYFLAGMPVIATKTKESAASVLPGYGVLIDDNPQSFAMGIEEILKNTHLYKSDLIKKSFDEYRWQNIIKNKLEPVLDKI